jgi:CheY-like chemotaxis protein
LRNVTEMHGGSVTASSLGLGHGTVFTVMLPLHEPIEQTDLAQVSGASCISRHILLVEDNADASEMLKMVLCSEGHTVVAAYDGITGLALACSGAFDVLLCDIGLPGMSGYDLVRNLRVSAGLEAPFCVAVSGYGQIEERTLAMAAGFDQHLVKPIDLATLLELVASAPLMLPHD